MSGGTIGASRLTRADDNTGAKRCKLSWPIVARRSGQFSVGGMGIRLRTALAIDRGADPATPKPKASPEQSDEPGPDPDYVPYCRPLPPDTELLHQRCHIEVVAHAPGLARRDLDDLTGP